MLFDDQQEAKLTFFKRKSSTRNGVVGLTFFSDGLALVQLDTSAEGDVTLRVAESVDCGASGHAEVLAELVQRHQLQNTPCCAVLARGTYNLIQIDQPDVPEAELRDAVRWQVKDLLDFPAEQAVIELFSAVGSAGGPMNFAVAAAQENIRYVVDVMQQANLAVKVIDIPELALRNVLDRSFESDRGVALLSLWRDNGLVTIVRNGELCMARRINLGVQELVAAADVDDVDGVEISQAQQNILDSVVLEIQRSLDYYESSVSRQPVSTVLLAPLTDPVPGLQSYLDSYLTPDVQQLDLGRWLDNGSVVMAEQSRCLAALGAALRSDWS
ncbi:MAG: pilus assembly protein PilM [Deltaproteobacteria bacterium]|nr:pilus assembly protein PilM [Deltaproteobacteria bacterium]